MECSLETAMLKVQEGNMCSMFNGNTRDHATEKAEVSVVWIRKLRAGFFSGHTGRI